MSDYFQNLLSSTLVDNDKVAGLQHLQGEDDTYGQYSKTLYGLDPTPVPLCGVIGGGDDKEVKCPKCSKTCRQEPNDIMKVVLDETKKTIEREIKRNSQYKPAHRLRDPFLVTCDLNKSLQNKDIFVWIPHLIYDGFTLAEMRCWQDGCNGKIRMLRILYRTVEGLHGVSFVLYAEYRCATCSRDKTSLDAAAMHAARVPPFVGEKCPVICFKNSAWERELYDMWLSFAPTEFGPSSFATLIDKCRTARWTEDATTYLMVLGQTLLGPDHRRAGDTLLNFGFHPKTEAKPFPPRDSHCGGYGSSKGPTATQLTTVLEAAAEPLSLFADAIMQALGGQVAKSDATYHTAQSIKVTTAEQKISMVETVNSGETIALNTTSVPPVVF